MKRQDKRKHTQKRRFFLSLLNVFFLGLLIFGGLRIYEMFQERDFQKKVAEVIAKEEKEHADNAEKQEGMIGSHYVAAFYPLMNGQPFQSAKEQILQDSQSITDDKKQAGNMTALTFYYTEERSSSLANTKEIVIQRKDYDIIKRTIKSEDVREIASTYINQEGAVVTLDKLFQNPEATKEIFINELTSQLTFRQVNETDQTAALNALREMDMSRWNFHYEAGLFSIRLPKEINGVTSLTVPLSNFYDQIHSEYLQGDDLEAYHQYEIKRHEKMVALTFDDGPDSKTTPQALEILKRYNAKATFFMVGQNVAANPELAKRVHDEGHQLGIHTWSHPVLTKLPLDQAKKEITDTQEAIYQATGIRPLITRPPYGAVNAAVQNAVDQSFIMWNVDSLDWKNRNTSAIMQEVAKTQPGSIILMHDIHQTTIDALPSVLEYLKNNGYTLVTVDELLENQLQPHQIYYSRN
mgnify:FL=1